MSHAWAISKCLDLLAFEEFLPSAANQGSFLNKNRNKDLPESSIQMCHRSWRQSVNENAGDALEVGHAAQADSQPDAGLWKAGQGGVRGRNWMSLGPY